MEPVLDRASIEELFISDFDNNQEIINYNSTDNIKKIRQKAIESFKNQGFPNTKNEYYRFTDIKKLIETSGRLVHQFYPPKITQPINEVFQCEIDEMDTYDIMVLDGWYPKTQPLFQKLSTGGFVGSFAEGMELYPEIIDQHYAKYADINSDPLIALNTAFAADGVLAYFPKDSKMTKPLQIVYVVSGKKDLLTERLVQPRNLFVIENNCDIKLVLCDHTLTTDKSLTNTVTEIIIGENSNVEIYRIQNQSNNAAQISNIHIQQKANSSLIFNTVTLNGGFIRNNLNTTLTGENCKANLYGLYLTDRTQHIDNTTLIDHASPNCQSHELFKGILDEKATGVFRGKIMVRKDAQKTDSYQKNNNLLLTDDANMTTMPQLEIYADDVKCSHGATIGYLDQEEMFYLRSRGINRKEARYLLMNAFASEIINKIKVKPLRERYAMLVSQRLRGELSPCASCVLKCYE